MNINLNNENLKSFKRGNNTNTRMNVNNTNELFSQEKKIENQLTQINQINPLNSYNNINQFLHNKNKMTSSSNIRQYQDIRECNGNSTVGRRFSSSINIHSDQSNHNMNKYEAGPINMNDNNIYGSGIVGNMHSNNFTQNINMRKGRECFNNQQLNMNSLNSIVNPIDNTKGITNYFNVNKNYPQISTLHSNNLNTTGYNNYNQRMSINRLNNMNQSELGYRQTEEFHSPPSSQPMPSSMNMNYNYYQTQFNNMNKEIYTKNKNNQGSFIRNSAKSDNYLNIDLRSNNFNNTMNKNNNNTIYAKKNFAEGNLFEDPMRINQQIIPSMSSNINNMPCIPNLQSSSTIYQNQFLPPNNTPNIPIKNEKNNNIQNNFDDNMNLNSKQSAFSHKAPPRHSSSYTPSNSSSNTHASSGNNQINAPATNKNSKKGQKFKKLNLNFEDLTDEELANQSLQIAKDQAGCRYLQKKIEECPKYANEKLFPKIFDHLYEFTTDSFGNYLIQKIIECLDDKKIELIINFIDPYFLELALNQHGTRVIQKVIECIKLDKHIDYFNKIFEPHLVELMKDVNGNHVIIKYANTIKYPKNQLLYDAVANNTIELATNKHACCAFQKCINNANKLQMQEIIEKIVDNTYILMSDPYGNYLLQFVLSMNDYETNYKITTYFKNRIGYLSKQKFSSNVIEKCFDHCDINTIDIMVKEICNPKIIADLLLDMYGNYGKIFNIKIIYDK